MPKIKANGITINYEQQGSGEPLILIPYLAADNACYAFQVAEYAKHFTCVSLDLRGTGESDKPEGTYTTELFADDVAAFMQASGIQKAHVSGLSLGAAVGMWLAAKHPEKVQSLSLHGGWTKTDFFLESVLKTWQAAAQTLGSVAEVVIRGIFPWCFTPELYSTRPDFIQSLVAFVHSRPAQPLAAFMQHSNAVLAHDVEAQLSRIKAPTQITFGRYDMLTARFGDALKSGIRDSELIIFEGCSHAALYENIAEFNQKTLEFLQGQRGTNAAVA